MQIIYKVDVIFTIIYSIILLVTGGILSIFSEKPIVFLITLLIEVAYLGFAFKTPVRRYRASKKRFPGEWREFVMKNSPFYRGIDDKAKLRFELDMRLFLTDFSIRSIRQGEVDFALKMFIASCFATILNGRPSWEPPIKDGVIVYPGETFNRHYELGRGNRAGQATINSPLLVTEESLIKSAQHIRDGFNVIFHEVAHYFDMEDGIAEGLPLARMNKESIEKWKSVIGREWENAFNGNSILGSYAGTNEAELFAVGVEFFFEKPEQLYHYHIELYEVISEFFNLDTLSILST